MYRRFVFEGELRIVEAVSADRPESGALVPATSGSFERPCAPRPAAPFLAQLIATYDHLPQARSRYRLNADAAADIYSQKPQARVTNCGRTCSLEA